MLYRAQIGGFLFGSCVGIGLISSTRVSLWRNNALVLDSYPELVAHNTNPWGEEQQQEEDGRLFGYAMRRYLKRQWNESVDAVAKPLIKFLAERNL